VALHDQAPVEHTAGVWRPARSSNRHESSKDLRTERLDRRSTAFSPDAVAVAFPIMASPIIIGTSFRDPLMPRLKASFEADWISHLREHMINVQGWSAAEVSALDNDDVCIRHFDALRRRIAAVPRVVKTADDFVCPPEHQSG
jgi:hypothetical protein